MRSTVSAAFFVVLLGWPAYAAPCLSDQGVREAIVGRLSASRTRDADGNEERIYILTSSTPVCLSTLEPGDQVDASTTVNVYASDERMMKRLAQSVGQRIELRGRPSPSRMADQSPPIMMDVIEIPSQRRSKRF